MVIVWDEPKRLANFERRKLDFAELNEDFFLSATLLPTYKGRRMAIGWFRGVPLTVIFKPLGAEAISVMSMRRASRKERRLL